MQFKRTVSAGIQAAVARGQSVLLLGPRQTGKTTLVKSLAPTHYLNLMDPTLRVRYESAPGHLIAEIKAQAKNLGRKPLVVIDEIQKVPVLTDCVQILIDDGIAQFVLTGSSSRQIKNLLPGRVIRVQLGPLTLEEFAGQEYGLEDILMTGTLPAMVANRDADFREQTLGTYSALYLDEEIRKEALVRNIGAFARFLEAASFSQGQILNYSNVSAECSVETRG